MEIIKKLNFENDIIFIDGIWGTGKSILGPIISGMYNVEKFKIEYIYEFICSLNKLGKISEDSAIWLLRTYADMSQYNNLISREVNFRMKDDSGFINNPNKLKSLLRLFKNDGDENIDSINENNIALNLMSHMLLLSPEPLKKAYGKRFKIIEVVRHPLYIINHWESYLKRFDSSREFTPSFYKNNIKVPWWASEFTDEYINYDNFNRTLLSVVICYNQIFDSSNSSFESENNLLFVSFESLVMSPQKELNKISSFLNRAHAPNINRILKKQKIPRKYLNSGLGHSSYGWKKNLSNEEEFLISQKSKINNYGDKENISRFNNIIDKYNSKFPSHLNYL